MTITEYFDKLPNRIIREVSDFSSPTIFHFKLWGDGGGEYTVAIISNKAVVSHGLINDPTCVIKTTDKIFTDAINGTINVQMSILKGHIKISNLGEYMKYAKSIGLA